MKNYSRLLILLLTIASCSSEDDKVAEEQQIGETNGYQYVDLGLSVKWATCNLGAEEPYETGNLYAWGETVSKNEFMSNNYAHWTDYGRNITKYCTDEEYGTADGLTVLTEEDDVVRLEMKGDWRMPTLKEVNELCTECTIKRDTLNNIPGISITGPNGNSMFVPGRTSWFQEYNMPGYFDYSFYYGGFWSTRLCTLYEQAQKFAYCFEFSTNITHGRVSYEAGSTNERYSGLACRGVIE